MNDYAARRETAACEVCGTVFVKQSPNQRFCSPKCKEGGYEHVCPQCGRAFRDGRPDTKYCSRKCVGAAKRTTTMAPRKCEVCGGTYKPTRIEQRTCSRECGWELWRRNQA